MKPSCSNAAATSRKMRLERIRAKEELARKGLTMEQHHGGGVWRFFFPRARQAQAQVCSMRRGFGLRARARKERMLGVRRLLPVPPRETDMLL